MVRGRFHSSITISENKGVFKLFIFRDIRSYEAAREHPAFPSTRLQARSSPSRPEPFRRRSQFASTCPRPPQPRSPSRNSPWRVVLQPARGSAGREKHPHWSLQRNFRAAQRVDEHLSSHSRSLAFRTEALASLRLMPQLRSYLNQHPWL